jgi:DNA invertase Pin-like site-specific DNA recombinase
MLAGLAEFERHLIVARTSEGRKRARARGGLLTAASKSFDGNSENEIAE